MESLVRNLRIIWRAELLIVEAKLHVALKRAGLVAFAGLVCVFGLGMLNLGAFFALEQSWGPVYAAFGVGAADLILAIFVLLWSSRLSTGPELDLAREVRDSGIQELERRAEHLQEDIEAVRDELFALRNSLTSFARNPVEGIGASLLAPLLTMLIKSLSTRKKS